MTQTEVTGAPAAVRPAVRRDSSATVAGTPRSSGDLGSYHVGLDGLRGMAMACLLLYHAGLDVTPGAYLALSQFFTLSGFLITSMLLGGHERGGVDVRRFWDRRIRRLVPASLVALAGVGLFGATVATRDQVEHLTAQVAASAAWVNNWYTIVADQSYVDLFAAPAPVDHFWSLSLEAQFYLFVSVGLALLLRRTARTSVLAALFGGGIVASTAWMVHLNRTGATVDRIYLGTDTRLAEFLAGSLLAVVLVRVGGGLGPRTRGFLAGLGAAAYLAAVWMWLTVPIESEPMWRGGIVGYAGMTVLVILGILVGRGPLAAFLGLWPIAALGRISYGVYLYHWPLFLWLTPDRTGVDGWTLFGLRAAVTLGAATVSYHLIELPIRAGAGWRLRPTLRIAALPVAAVLVVGWTWAVTDDREAPDPLATLRDDEASLTAPITPDDGTLDVLAITDATGTALIDRVEELGEGGDAVRVVRSEFRCGAAVTDGAVRTCREWLDEWPRLIAEHNPDIVLLFVDEWRADDIRRVSTRPPQELAAAAEELLGAGLDLLTARDAPVLWAQPGGSFGVRMQRSTRPFDQAMAALGATRDDLRQILGGRLPDPAEVGAEEYVDAGAAALLADLSLYQRAAHDRLPHVLVVGDSQARSLGYGLERWATASERAVVWNAAVAACGIADEGSFEQLGREVEVDAKCKRGIAAWPDHVASFDPDLVVVLTSVWDLTPRRLPGATRLASVEAATVRSYLRGEYQDAVSTLTSGGAHLVWMTAPCMEAEAEAGPGGVGADTLTQLNQEVIEPAVEASGSRAQTFDLADVLCPDADPVEVIDDNLDLRSDGIHFSVEGSMWFAETYGDRLLASAGL